MTSAVKMTMTKTHIKTKTNTKTNMKTMTMTKCLKDPPHVHVLTAAPKFLRAYNVKSSSTLFADNIP